MTNQNNASICSMHHEPVEWCNICQARKVTFFAGVKPEDIKNTYSSSLTNQNNELKELKREIDEYVAYLVDVEGVELSQYQQSKITEPIAFKVAQALYAPKPVENGELREHLESLYNGSMQLSRLRVGSPIDNMVDGALALIAQEKAKWVAEVRQQLERSKKIYVKHGKYVTELNEPPLIITTDYKYMVDWSDIAKLLDKKSTKHCNDTSVAWCDDCLKLLDTKGGAK